MIILESPIVVLAVAWVIDRSWGEPPAVVHPVVGIGRLASWWLRVAPPVGPRRQLGFGAVVAIGVPLVVAGLGQGVVVAVARWPWLAMAASVYLLTSCFAVRALGTAGRRVEQALARGDLATARVELGGLCSRDAESLDASQVAAGAIESLAENASDSVVAPIFYYGLFGLPGALVYRAINTLDAMIGYHGKYEHLGKVAARLDDLANLIPARITAGLLIVAGVITGGDVRSGWSVARRHARRTESPNAGWPMAAMAGLLGVTLAKPGAYTLGEGSTEIDADDVARARRIVALACELAVLLAGLAMLAGSVLPTAGAGDA